MMDMPFHITAEQISTIDEPTNKCSAASFHGDTPPTTANNWDLILVCCLSLQRSWDSLRSFQSHYRHVVQDDGQLAATRMVRHLP